ncbi:long chain polyunsaturated fatty acid elongation enzyme, putative [Plasmodium vinckei]|uniref:Elongation of fatty acids protein n=2 Tax=Plasmodium vinckei TaxID=5860 RepID=A0A6V7S9U1_PLAVN|nr:long chain polyunsaturated fatty acid elongation enzyme, putative [Plasmodium vinckei petteri]CAD2095339.1 long chain polyunsaturated fatty acid elongation enzyme, putative [Plasmodium vinckei]
MAFNILFLNNLGERILQYFNASLKPGRRVTKDWFMINPTHFFIVFFAYIIFIFIAYIYKSLYATHQNSDKLSKTKPSSKIKSSQSNTAIEKIVPIYNLIQVLLSTIICVLTIYNARKRGFKLFYNYVDFTKTNIAFWCWLFYLNKIFDFVDTILITIKKNWKQFSFLHVYHHISIFLIMWINTSVGYDGDVYYIIVSNSFVHSIMYAYYFFASLKYKIPVYLKSCVTYIQMLQFVSMILPGFCIFFLKYKTPHPIRLVGLCFYYCITLLILFCHFSYKTYIRPKTKVA